jgi:CBS domain-containing protein
VKAKDIMTQNPACVTPADSLRDAARAMRENDAGALPVVEDANNRRLIGMITDRDIAIRAVADGKGADTLVRDVMTDGPDAVRADDDVQRVVEVMESRQVRRVPIIDENGGVIGMVAQADIARHDRAASDRQVGRVVEAISEPRGRAER